MRELVDALILRLTREAGDVNPEGGVGPEVECPWLIEIRDSMGCRCATNTARMSTSAQTLLHRLYVRPEVSAVANRKTDLPLRPDELAILVRLHSTSQTVSDVPILDECKELLGPMLSSSMTSHEVDEDTIEHAREVIEAQNLGGGIVTAQVLAERVASQDTRMPLSRATTKDCTQAYGHIVVDEAQKFSLAAQHALLRHCPSRSFTVVGDLDQRRGSKRLPTWEKALGSTTRAFATECAPTVSYRTPVMLTTLAEGIVTRAGVPVLYPMTVVRDVEDCYHITYVDAPKDAPASPSKGNSPL